MKITVVAAAASIALVLGSEALRRPECDKFNCCANCKHNWFCPKNKGCMSKDSERCSVPLCSPSSRWDIPMEWTFKKLDNCLTFMVLGDWGGVADTIPFTTSQKKSAIGMGHAAKAMKASFVIGLGDNFYGHGIKEGNQFRFKATYEDIYTNPSLTNIPWYTVAGNHDWTGHANLQYQLDYTLKSPRWVMPSAMFTVRRQLPTGETVKFVMFDHLAATRSYYKYQPIKAKIEGVEWEPSRVKDAWSWLERELANSKDEYLFLVDHHPVYTVCSHKNTHALKGIPALMKKYKVTAFMSGHDHCMMHMSHDGQTYLLQGGHGAQSWNPNSNQLSLDALGVKTHWEKSRSTKKGISGGFSSVEMYSDHMKFRFHRESGDQIHELILQPRAKSMLV